MTFKADEFVGAMDPPSIEIKGKLYVGRVLSELEYEALTLKFDRWKDGQFDDPAQEIRDILGQMGFTPEAVQAILGLPPAAIYAACIDFFMSSSQLGPQVLLNLARVQTNGSSLPKPAGAKRPENRTRRSKKKALQPQS